VETKTYFITGANSEIGAEICRIVLASGHSVLATFHSKRDRLYALKSEFSNLTMIKADFRDQSCVETLVAEKRDILCRVDAFISCAAARNDVSYGEISSEDLLEHFKVNVLPHVLLVQFFGPFMEQRNWGRIVICSSIGVKFGGGDDSFCYSLSKFAGELIPKAASKWSVSNVLYNVVRVGVTHTDSLAKIGQSRLADRANLIPLKRLALPHEIAKAVYWLASSDNTYITGQNISVSGGE